MGRGMETFVLDMGEPVRIADLASDLIRLSGLEVGTDIEIRFTGTRPGEKLYEELFFSAASLWEIAIKSSLGRDDFVVDARLLRRGLLDNGYSELPVISEHAVAIDALPPIHKDPFARLLIAQSMIEGITLLTADETVARYPGPIRKC